VGLRRKINEDSLFVDSEHGLWAVADGMGGHEAGEIASTMVTDALRCLPHFDDLEERTAAAIEALRGVNSDLIGLARANSDANAKSIGTTVVGLAIADGSFCCFWMGDSRVYRLRGTELTRVTRDHSLVQNLVDAGMLTAEQAETHENANLITKAVGVDANFVADIVRGDVQPGDQFLLASDGLTRVVRDDELAGKLSGGPPGEVADRMIDTVLERGAPDNVSLIIAKVL
jgi:serine/threonine protein phosphatase PrpC